jgi:integrase
MGTYSYKRAFDTARRRAGVNCRLCDAKHSFITRLAENGSVSEDTIRQLAGHVSARIAQARYAHIRAQARRDAIAALERSSKTQGINFEADSPQNPPQFASSTHGFPN